jgi:DNA sulfur modification protein DndD
MKIELKGWESRGLRCPDAIIDLSGENGSIVPISLIQMPNGTGKTTMLNMLRATMSGEAEKWDEKIVKSYRQPGDENEKGHFSVHLMVENKPLTFELTLNFDEGSARYRTTSPGSGGVIHGWHPPSAVLRFFSENFVRLFVFDGEFADRLLNSEYSEAEKAIDALCQLYLLDAISNQAENVWQRASRNKTVKTDQGLNTLRKNEEKLKGRIQIIIQASKKAESEIIKLTNQIDEFEAKLTAHMGTQRHLREKYDEEKRHELEAQGEVGNATLNVMGLLRQPQTLANYFADDLTELKDQLDKLKLPSSTSSQFFIELLDEAECICGRPMNEEVKATIQEKAKRYLGAETSGVINALKSDIDLLVMQEESPKESDLTNAMESLDAAITKKLQIEAVTRALRDQLIEEGDEDLKILEKNIQEKKEKRSNFEKTMNEINRDANEDDDNQDIENIYCLKALNKMYKDVIHKISETTGTIELREKTSTLKRICQIALVKSREYIRAELTKECNDKLETILARSPLKIESIGHSLRLRNQDGASVGQTLSVGYTFLTNLLHRGMHQFPLVVDSPANPLSIEVRREIGKLIPSLCKQFVGFTISSEREGFVSTIELQYPTGIKYITMFRKCTGTENLMPGIEEFHYMQNDTCVQVFGKEYFNKFDMEEE